MSREDTDICKECHMEYALEELSVYKGKLVCPFCDVPIGDDMNA